MAELLGKDDHRTHYCTQLTKADVGAQVCLMGWCQRQRDLGQLIFIDLRDRTGIIQLAFDAQTPRDVFDTAFGVRAEYVLCAKGTVRLRSSVNPNLPTGEIEIAVDTLRVLSEAQTPPFAIEENSAVKAETRLKYRYLDLRRPDLQRNIMMRHQITRVAHEYFAEQGFIEIETPNLVKPTPEGARDYLVPSRVHPGKFYALPQSPQIYKQLLMVSGFDRYMQIARCYRDEDLRADRQPEFTQLDLEMSFVHEDDVIAVNEGFLKRLFAQILHMDIQTPFVRIPWKEAMERYGSDKPDLRFGLELQNVSDVVADCGFGVFENAVKAGGSVRAIVVKGKAEELTRKTIDALTQFVKTYRAHGLAYWRNVAGEVTSSFFKFLSEEKQQALIQALQLEENDVALFVADQNTVVFDALGALRCELARRLHLIKPGEYRFAWVTEFPMYEYSEEDGRYYAMHHPFTAPMDEDISLMDVDPSNVRAKAYDIVINGYEAGGGSIRIHSPEIQEKMFRVLGMPPEEYQSKFGFLLEAFQYGVPPHGGLAFGLDRLVMLLLGLDDIRDVIAFPKVQNASELMTKCPSAPEPNALAELHIAVTETEDETKQENDVDDAVQ